jgi:FtsZ-binding cell division protein ZapB
MLPNMELLDGVGLDPLTNLEERIQRAVEIIPQLREEKESAVREKEVAVREAAEARAKFDELTSEVDSLRQEREQVRARIEKLLGQMDVLGAG